MPSRKKKAKASPLMQILQGREPGNISLGYAWLGSAFFDHDPSRRALVGCGVPIININANRIARNVRASLEYEHAEDRFNLDPACWFVADDNQHLFAFVDYIDLKPAGIQWILIAIVRGEGRKFDSYAAMVKKLEQNILDKAQLLQPGKWKVKGTIIADNCRPLRITVTFRIDETGNLVDLSSSRSLTSSGPKGPHKGALERDRLIGASKKTGRKLCDYLTKVKCPLPSKKLRDIYKSDWVLWFDNNPEAVYKYFSAARKRFRQNISISI